MFLLFVVELWNGSTLCMCYSTFVSAAQEALSSTPGLPPGSGGNWDTDLCSLMATKLFLAHTGMLLVGVCECYSPVSKTELANLSPNWLSEFYL